MGFSTPASLSQAEIMEPEELAQEDGLVPAPLRSGAATQLPLLPCPAPSPVHGHLESENFCKIQRGVRSLLRESGGGCWHCVVGVPFHGILYKIGLEGFLVGEKFAVRCLNQLSFDA